MTVFRQDDAPEVFFSGDRFVDNFDEDKIYIANDDGNMLVGPGIIPADFRPGSVDLSVQAAAGVYANLTFVDGGALNQAPVLNNTGGTGVEGDPYLYNLILYNYNSNDDIISAPTVTADPNLSFSGADATRGSVIPLSGFRVGSYAQRLIPASLLPGSVPLLFRAVAIGNAGNHIKVEILDGGPAGSASLAAVTGTGTRGDEYIYTFTIYDNSTSADIVALLSGDPNLTAVGGDAVTSSATAVAQSRLDNGVGVFWDAHAVYVTYTAEYGGLTVKTQDIPTAFPRTLRNVLAEALAARMASMTHGGDMNRAARWASIWALAFDKALEGQHSNSYPTGMRPG